MADLSAILGKEKSLFSKLSDRDGIKKYSVIIEDYDHLNAFLKENSEQVFFDFLLALNDRTPETFHIFRLLKKHNIKYYTIDAGGLPVEKTFESKSKRLERIISKLNPKTAYLFAQRCLISILNKHLHLLQPPYRVFSLENELTYSFLERFRIPHSHFHKINSEDYTTYKLTEGIDEGIDIDKDFILFIDQNIPYHMDALDVGRGHIPPDEYFHTLNKFFDRVEAIYKLPIVIAAHPRACYQDNQYKNRKVFYGKTSQLTRKSKAVITHDSTAINYAILKNIPTTFILTKGMVRVNRHHDVYSVANALNSQPLNIDSSSLNDNDIHIYQYDKESYARYLTEYVKSRNDDKTFYEVIIDYLKKDLSQETA